MNASAASESVIDRLDQQRRCAEGSHAYERSLLPDRLRSRSFRRARCSCCGHTSTVYWGTAESRVWEQHGYDLSRLRFCCLLVVDWLLEVGGRPLHLPPCGGAGDARSPAT